MARHGEERLRITHGAGLPAWAKRGSGRSGLDSTVLDRDGRPFNSPPKVTAKHTTQCSACCEQIQAGKAIVKDPTSAQWMHPHCTSSVPAYPAGVVERRCVELECLCRISVALKSP